MRSDITPCNPILVIKSLVSIIVKVSSPFLIRSSKAPVVGREVSWLSTGWYWSRDLWKGLELCTLCLVFLFFMVQSVKEPGDVRRPPRQSFCIQNWSRVITNFLFTTLFTWHDGKHNHFPPLCFLLICKNCCLFQCSLSSKKLSDNLIFCLLWVRFY